MLPNLAFSLVSSMPNFTPLYSMDLLDDVALLQIAVLQQDLLERDVQEVRKRKGEDSEDIRPVHGWQKTGKGCMDITLD